MANIDYEGEQELQRPTTHDEDADDLLEEQEGKGYGEDEGEREESLDEQ
jgi:hypothetical protein